MGKYDKFTKVEGEYKSKELFLKLKIANELAEGNRLKRIELEVKTPTLDLKDEA